MQFDVLVQQLLEYWDRTYSSAGSIAQKPVIPEVPATMLTKLFPRSKRRKSRARKHKNTR